MMNESGQSLFKRIGIGAAAVALAAGSVFAFNFPGFGGSSALRPVNGAVTIQAAQVDDGKARFYQFADAGKEIKFFVVKGTDGAYHVAFDACDACFREKKGYAQDGNVMVCRNCNMKFAVNRIGAANKGGCNPAHLDFAVSGGNLVIKVADLTAGARFF